MSIVPIANPPDPPLTGKPSPVPAPPAPQILNVNSEAADGIGIFV